MLFRFITDWSSRYNGAPNNYRDDEDEDIYTKASELLQKYPWLIKELTENGNEQQHRQTPVYRPSQNHESDEWFPRRQWGRQGDLWSRKQREAAKEGIAQNHVHKRAVRQHHKDQSRNIGNKFFKNVKHELPKRHQTSKTHSKKSYPQRTGHPAHFNHQRKYPHLNLNSKLAKHLPTNSFTRHRRPHRSKRHAGLHDDGGAMRLLSTGALAPPLDDVDSSRSIDLLFATYWFFPTEKQVSLSNVGSSRLGVFITSL